MGSESEHVAEAAPAAPQATSATPQQALAPAPAPAAEAAARPWRLAGGATPPEARLLADPALRHERNGRSAAALLRAAQRQQGNAALAGALRPAAAAPELAESGLLRSPAGGGGVSPAATLAARRDASAGDPLPREVESDHAERLGSDLGGVRVHTDQRAADLAAGLRARAFTRGSDVYFARGRFAPASVEGRRLLGHELAHVAQGRLSATGAETRAPAELEREAHRAGEAAVAGRPAALGGRTPQPAPLLRDPDDPTAAAQPLALHFSVYMSSQPLARYTHLKRVSPESWQALDQTARTLSLGYEEDPAADPASAGPGITEVSLPVRWLVKPAIPPSREDDLRSRLWPLVSDPDPYVDAITDELTDELSSRWAAQNQELLDRSVRIRLIPPSEVESDPPVAAGGGLLSIGEQRVLAFDIDGEPIESGDGALGLLDLDLMGSNNLEEIVAALNQEATVIAQAGDLFRASTKVLDFEVDFWEKVRNDPDSAAKNEVDAHYGLFSIRIPDQGPVQPPLLLSLSFFLQDHPEYQDVLGEPAQRVDELSGWVQDDYPRYLDYFDSMASSGELSTMREGLDATWDQAARMWDQEGVLEGGLGYTVAGLGSFLYHVMNTASFDYLDTRYAGVQAFRQGKISYDQLEELSNAAALRGAAVGLVGLALTAVTAGLAGPVLGTAASLGQKMLFYGVAGAATNVTTELAGTGISAAGNFEDPTLQGIWKRGVHGPGRIALSGATGFGIGAASVPAGLLLGKLVRRLGGGAAAAESSALAPAGTGAPAETALPPGWTAEAVSGDTLRFTHPDLPGEVIVTPTSLRYQIPAGTGMHVAREVPFSGAGEAPTGLLPEGLPELQPGELPAGEVTPFAPAEAPGEVPAVVAGEEGALAQRQAGELAPGEAGGAPSGELAPARPGGGPQVILEVPLGVTAPRLALPRTTVTTPPGGLGTAPSPAGQPQLPGPAPRLALPAAGMTTGSDTVWVNPGSRVYHPPGSFWFGRTQGGRYMRLADAQASGFRPAGQLPASGVYEVSRPPLGEPRTVIRSRLQAPQPRRGYEKQMASAAEYATQELVRWERAHSQGAGLGAEAREAIRLAPRYVNQALQNRGVERTLRELYRIKPADVELRLTTVTKTHPNTLRLKEIEYVLEAYRGETSLGTVFEASIEVSRGGRAVASVEAYGHLLEDLARSPEEGAGGVDSISAAAIAAARADHSAGEPLPAPLASLAARRLGPAAGAARLHADRRAARLAAGLEAHAFTRDRHVYFAAGAFDPSSASGLALLGHELAHVAQQGGERRAATTVAAIDPPGSPRERAAEAAGRRLAGGAEAERAEVWQAGAGALQRREGAGTAQGLIDRYTSWGDLDEEGLGQKLFELAWMSADHYAFVTSVIDALGSTDQDDVSLAFAMSARDDNLDEFAATDSGRAMMQRMETALLGGFSSPAETREAMRLRLAVGRWQAAEEGKRRGLQQLDQAAAAATDPAAAGLVKVLSITDLQLRLRLVETILGRLKKKDEKDPGLLAAIATASTALGLARSGLAVSTAARMSRLVPDAQSISERVETVVAALDLQLAAYGRSGDLGVLTGPIVELTRNVRAAYVVALGLLFTDGAAAAFNRAEARAAALPRALTEVDLAQLEQRAPTYKDLRPSRLEIAAWARDVQAQLDALQTEAGEVRRARESRATDLAEREARFVQHQQVIELSIQGLHHWERAMRAWEYLVGQSNIIGSAYGALERIFNRCRRMRQAAADGDLVTLRQREEAHRTDPAVERFYAALPLFAFGSRFLITFGIALAAAVATAGVGGMVAGAIGTTTTATGSALAFTGTVAVEALTFTAVSRGLQDVALGDTVRGSFLRELVINFGLFGILRGASQGIRSALEAQGLLALERPAVLASSVGILEGYGILRFRAEEGRWPTSSELGMMTAENLIMAIGIAVTTGALQRIIGGRANLPNLDTFEHKYGWRFELLELSRQKLINAFRSTLAAGEAADPAKLARLKEGAQAVDEAARALVEEIKGDKAISLEATRKELESIGLAMPEASEELLAKSLGLPEEVRLRREGGLDQYTYRSGGTGKVEAGLRALGATVEKSSEPATGLRTISATFPDRPPMTFVERPSPFPAAVEVDVDPTDPAVQKLVGDFSIDDPAAQRFLVHLLEIEVAKGKGAAPSLGPASKAVRKLLARLATRAGTAGTTTEAELLTLRARGLLASEATPAELATVDTLEKAGIISSTEWLSARVPGEFEGAVSEWIAYQETAAATPAGRTVLRQVHLIGDLFEDAALTRPRLEKTTGGPRVGLDVVPELDLLTVSRAGDQVEIHNLGNVKGFASGSGDAANQNALALAALRAHIRGVAVEVTTREGETAFARVTRVTALDPATGAKLDLTGKLVEAKGGAATETIGPQKSKGTYDREVSLTKGDVAKIARLLRERQAMKAPGY